MSPHVHSGSQRHLLLALGASLMMVLAAAGAVAGRWLSTTILQEVIIGA